MFITFRGPRSTTRLPAQTCCAVALAVLSLLLAFPSHGCGPEGAYGFTFGTKPKLFAKRLWGNDASVWYVGDAPSPDPRFDRYELKYDSETRELFEIVAIKTVTPPLTNTAEYLPPDQQEFGRRRARAFAEAYISMLGADVAAALMPDEYGGASWSGAVSKGYMLGISASGPWDVHVSCMDLGREWALGRRVAPELFGALDSTKPNGMPVPSKITAPVSIPAQTSCPPAAIESGGEAVVPESFKQMYPNGGQTRTLEQVQSIFHRNKQAFISIYNRASQEQPCLAGKVYFAIAIHADGSVANVQVVRSTVNSSSFEQKLSQRIALVRFPPVEGHGFYVLIYPMTFSGN
jgi:hypothetical protein